MFASHEASLTHKEIVFINIKIADSFFFVYGMFWLGKSFFLAFSAVKFVVSSHLVI